MSGDQSEKTTYTTYHALGLEKQPCLIVVAGSDIARRYDLDEPELVIGRVDEADLVLDDAKASRRHARVIRLGESVAIEDLGSTNGTYVNNARVAHAVLQDGDLISIGNSVLKFSLQSAVDAAFHDEIVGSAHHDALTGLVNRGYFMKQLQAEFARSGRYGGEFSLVLCDLDNFKSINDRFGHQVGDLALKVTAGAISGSLRRQIDLAGRYGGEELVVLLPDTPLTAARNVAEKIRAAVEALDVNNAESGFQVTVSVGVASSDEADTPDTLLGLADERMYLAKRNGKNRVEGG